MAKLELSCFSHFSAMLILTSGVLMSLMQGCKVLDPIVTPLNAITNSMAQMNGKLGDITNELHSLQTLNNQLQLLHAAVVGTSNTITKELSGLREDMQDLKAQMRSLSALAHAAVPALAVSVLQGGGLARDYNFYLAYETGQDLPPSDSNLLCQAWCSVYAPIVRAIPRKKASQPGVGKGLQRWFDSATVDVDTSDGLEFRKDFIQFIENCERIDGDKGEALMELQTEADRLVTNHCFGTQIMAALSRSLGKGMASVQILISSNTVAKVTFDAYYADFVLSSNKPSLLLDLLSLVVSPQTNEIDRLLIPYKESSHRFYLRSVTNAAAERTIYRLPSVLDILTGNSLRLSLEQGSLGEATERIPLPVKARVVATSRGTDRLEMTLRTCVDRTGRLLFWGEISMAVSGDKLVKLARFVACPAIGGHAP